MSTKSTNGKVQKQTSPTQLASPHVALYMRVSSDDQAERGTIGAQRDFLRQFAHLYSLPIVEEYEDDGITGTLPLSQRPAGRRLLDDAQQGRSLAVSWSIVWTGLGAP